MAGNTGINYNQQPLATYANSGLDEFFPELAEYDSYETPYAQPQDSLALHNANQQQTLLGLGAQLEHSSTSDLEFRLLDSLSRDIQESYTNGSPSGSRNVDYSAGAKETAGGMYSLSNDYYQGDHSGQLF